MVFTASIFTKLMRLVSGIEGKSKISFTAHSKVLLSSHRYSQTYVGSAILCGDRYAISCHIDQETLKLLVEFRLNFKYDSLRRFS